MRVRRPCRWWRWPRCTTSRRAREILAAARDILGGNGIVLDYHVARHLCDIEAIYTYEGTDTVQELLVGSDITGQYAFLPSTTRR